ncbi:GntR family transcriptional regulator [Herbiconiux moechotypicola]|uniref:HTH gntR-type domain-containing protein n=1 Tax=Herbiconiux moechotypicola TaxID=637393 RepID=A0ABN3DPR4_9MICO|nr:GntR family transcriptional regulator [Herbiconiux moechotypicola]MCS5731678.1 GntR family transcriptional regulator [Herbiconiux moechotypicola]
METPRPFKTRQPKQHGAHRLYALLRMAVKLGDWDPSTPIDERRLSNEWLFSRAEVREVLRLLTEEGLLTRQVSIGTFVAAAPVPIDLFDFTSLDPRFHLTRRQTDKFVIDDGEFLSSKFGASGTLVVTEHHLMMNDEIVAVNTAFSPTGAKSGRTRFEEVEHQVPLTGQFPVEYGVDFGGIEISVDSRMADAQVAALLDVEAGAPILMRDQVLSDDTGKVWEYSLSQWRADRVVFRAQRRVVDAGTQAD